MPDGGIATELSRTGTVLSEQDAVLGRFTASSEHEFLEIGHVLGRAVEAFGQAGRDFAELAGRINGSGAGDAAETLARARHALSAVSLEGVREVIPMLSGLESRASEVVKRLGLLTRIVSEIQALAINGKIQASLVSEAGMDFSVFTTEIGRLGEMAATAITQLSNRVAGVKAAVVSALAGAVSFEQAEARELELIRERVEAGLTALAERRRAVGAAADSISRRTLQISGRIAATVGELQINDNVNQRIEHVRNTLRLVGEWASGTGTGLAGIAEDCRPAVAAGLCRLCAAQLKGGGDDYGREVGGLAANLAALSSDAAEILSDAARALEGGAGGVFVAEIEADIRRASALLSSLHAGRARSAGMIQTVTASIQAMGGDLQTIRSIDADMRVMGLNATLKCGHLGNAGRALGVVSTELRGCSKRTEDGTIEISRLLEDMLETSRRIAGHPELAAGADNVGQGELEGAVAALSGMGQGLSTALDQLRDGCGSISSDLSRAARDIAVHRRFDAAAATVIGHLEGLWPGTVPFLDADGHRRILDLTYSRYTMVRERLIHRNFAAGFVEVDVDITASPPVSDAQSGDAVDDLFF